MISDILKQLNWIDFLMIVLFLRIIFMALSTGFALELFKLLGTLASLYISLHYFTVFTDWMGGRSTTAKGKFPLQFMDFISLIAIAIIGYLIFVALRLVFDRFIKMEIHPLVNKGVALMLGSFRGLFLTSLLAFILAVSSVGYLKDSVRSSFTGRRVFNLAVDTYSWTWDHIASRFSAGEKFNSTVLEVQKDLNP
ncbi:MAG: CvpA family protein [Candidatus Omnitrophota bacterium]